MKRDKTTETLQRGTDGKLILPDELKNELREYFRDDLFLEFQAKALGPLDGRYATVGMKLSPYFSEYALVKNRVKVEIAWLDFLLGGVTIDDCAVLRDFDRNKIPILKSIADDFSFEDFKRVKTWEKQTNHDVKSVELFIADRLKELNFSELVSFVHIGCTSEDINNTAYAIMISGALNNVWLPAAEKLILTLRTFAKKYAATPMLAHTHGQPATPTTVGKEFAVYISRLEKVFFNIANNLEISAKFNGATGNYSAISVAFPNVDWVYASRVFVEAWFDLTYNPVTTQIEGHDYMAELFDEIRRFNNILLDLDIDAWLYISMQYFGQIPVKSEVGSSTMPHKINPIRFENSESNIDLSNAILVSLSNKLLHSRLQRDLSDSSSQRNIGVGFGYSLQAINQTIGGLAKIAINEEKINEELANNWEVLAEPIQTMLRKYGIPDAYNKLKELTRGEHVSKEVIHEFIKSLDVLSEKDMQTLLELTPSTYTGYAETIAELVV